uniref:EF-hand domain-containing protein n=1 Tax=Haptolina brevifila TaxID=156173 RepID=A0A7S2E5S3_9EUKA
MCKRSGAKLLAINDIDRIFQRANTDNRGTLNSRGSLSSAALNLNLDQTQVAKITQIAIDELASRGQVENDAGESEMRDKLHPLFDEFDEDGSGSVSTEEIGKMAAKLGMEMTTDQLLFLMEEADPDGSGEIEFEELVTVLMKQMKEGRNGSMAALFRVKTEQEGDGGAASMVLLEFIHALIRMAWECYGENFAAADSVGIGQRLNALLERAVLPGSAHFIESADPMEAEMRSKRVQAITDYYSNELLDIFKVFAASDTSLTAQAHSATLSFPELVFMMKSGGMLDANLTVQQMTALFAQVNAQASDDGEKDDDSEELSFHEFKSLVCRIANIKIPASQRGGEPFEYTWQSFLQIIFIPRFRSLIKDMKRGLAKKSL